MKKILYTNAFSLVEVTLSLGIVSLSMLTLLAMVPIGLHSTSDSLRKAQAANISSQIEDDLRSTPLTSGSSTSFKIPVGTAGTNNYFFAADGSFTTTVVRNGSSSSIYEATVINTPPSASVSAGVGPNIIRIIVSWPAGSNAQGQLPSGSQGYCEFDTALDRH